MADNFKLEYYKDEDYPMLVSWWKDWGEEPVKKECLPKRGVIVINGDEGVCAAFLVETNTPTCFIEAAVSNKKMYSVLTKEENNVAGDILITGLSILAKNLGFKKVICEVTLRYDKLAKRFYRLGFKKGKDPSILLTRRI